MGSQQSKAQALADRVKSIEAIKMKVDEVDSGGFYDRKEEMSNFLDLLKEEPDTVTILIGPNDCGKSTFLRHFRSIWMGDSLLRHRSPVLYVDCRKRNIQTPRDLAVALRNSFRKMIDTLSNFAGASLTVAVPKVNEVVAVDVGKVMETAFGSAPADDLTKLINVFSDLVESNTTTPIFILDEANYLQSWSRRDLKVLMNFFKSISKQDQQAYVILSSSDDFFHTWLKQMFNSAQWSPFALGFFSEATARAHLEQLVKSRSFLPQVDDESWAHVYNACGGVPLYLKMCARYAARVGWKKAALSIVEGASFDLEAMWSPRGMWATRRTNLRRYPGCS